MADASQSARLLGPLVAAFERHVIAPERVHVDDTVVQVFDPGSGPAYVRRVA